MNNKINSQDRVLKPLIAIAIIQAKIILKKINSRTCRTMVSTVLYVILRIGA